MIINRLIALQSCLLAGFGTVFLLPKQIQMQPADITLDLPASAGHWTGSDQPISEGERSILGPDTQFARKIYRNSAGDEIYASVVLSGPDMNTSIHRPERCLPAQGWTITESKTTALPVNGQELKATRLHNVRNVRVENNSFTIHNIDYYWFVGHSDVTPSHLERTWIDIRDRVLKGQNQQWAYVTIASNVTKDFKVAGRSAAEVDELITDFVREFAPKVETRFSAQK